MSYSSRTSNDDLSKIAAKFRPLQDPEALVMKIHQSNPKYWNKLNSNEAAYRKLNNDLSNNQINLFEDALNPIYLFYFEQHYFAAEDLFHNKKIWHALSL